MNYKTPYDTQYRFKKGFPMVGVFLFLIFMQWMIYGSGLMAGDTMFKECKNCGHWNYQFSNTCSLCGESGRFEDVYLKPDCEKRDAKKKKKGIVPKAFHYGDIDKFLQEGTYDQFIVPLNRQLGLLIDYRQFKMEFFDGKIPEGYFEDLDAAFDNILRSREQLLKFHDLQDFHKKRF